MGTLPSSIPSHARRGTSPACRGAKEQLPKLLPKEPGREAAPLRALAEVAEVAEELAQEQCLGLRQCWGGQQGSGSLATLLQARGLCNGGEIEGERSGGEVGASSRLS